MMFGKKKQIQITGAEMILAYDFMRLVQKATRTGNPTPQERAFLLATSEAIKKKAGISGIDLIKKYYRNSLEAQFIDKALGIQRAKTR